MSQDLPSYSVRMPSKAEEPSARTLYHPLLTTRQGRSERLEATQIAILAVSYPKQMCPQMITLMMHTHLSLMLLFSGHGWAPICSPVYLLVSTICSHGLLQETAGAFHLRFPFFYDMNFDSFSDMICRDQRSREIELVDLMMEIMLVVSVPKRTNF